MNTHFLIWKLPIYLLIIFSGYSTFRDFRKQTEWNTSKRWNLTGFGLAVFSVFLFGYEDFLME